MSAWFIAGAVMQRWSGAQCLCAETGVPADQVHPVGTAPFEAAGLRDSSMGCAAGGWRCGGHGWSAHVNGFYMFFFLHNIFLAGPVFAAKSLVEQGESRKSRAPKIRKREMKTMVNVRNANRSKPEQIGCEPEENYSKW